MSRMTKLWLKFLAAIIGGNIVYFTLERYFPPAARHRAYQLDLGSLVDLWFCVVIYGLIELVLFFLRKRRQRS